MMDVGSDSSELVTSTQLTGVVLCPLLTPAGSSESVGNAAWSDPLYAVHRLCLFCKVVVVILILPL